MTTVRLGASMSKNVQDVIAWLHDNVGKFKYRKDTGIVGTEYIGENWQAKWRQYGSGWFMDITFDDSKHATFFTLRWK